MAGTPKLEELYVFSERKRYFDILVGTALMAASYPIEKIVVRRLAKDLDDGPSYVEQIRVGGVRIRKARTMNGPDDSSNPLPVVDSSSLADLRIPSVFAENVRRKRIDELPQIRDSVITSLQDDPNRLSLVGVRALLEKHADEFYKYVLPIDPELADRWRGEWVEKAPKGVTGPAALKYAARRSNREVDPYDWVKMEDEYCMRGTMVDDIRMLGRTGLLLMPAL